jgi:hypothetical protein
MLARMTTSRDRRKEFDRRHLYVNTGQASEMLGGLLSPNTLRLMALRGEIKGALRVHRRVLIPIRALPTLVTELEFHAALPTIGKRSRRAPAALDGALAG